MNIANIDLNLLVTFDALMEERSVTRAAARIGLSQPAMSNSLARLRAALEDPLFVRRAGSMVPTPRARLLAGPVRTALAQLQTALSGRARFDPSISTKTFTISTTDYIEFVLLGPLLRHVLAHGPGIQLRMRRPDQLFLPPLAALRQGEVDAAIGFFPGPTTPQSAIRTQTLYEEQNICIVRRDHPRVHKVLGPKQFRDLNHLGVFYRPDAPGLIDISMASAGSVRNLRFISPHFLVAPFIVAATDLIAVVPKRLAMAAKKFLPLRSFDPPLDLPKFIVRLLWDERNQDEPSHVWLREQILQATKEVAV